MARRKSSVTEEVAMDMTPMIDVVFQLIIFFMLVTDMTQQDLEELKLPVAEMAVKDETEEGRFTINIKTDGEIIVKRQSYGTMDTQTAVNAMRSFLLAEVLKGELDPKDGTSDRPILIRADQHTEFKHIQKIMRLCGENGIKIWKIHLAAAQNEQP